MRPLEAVLNRTPSSTAALSLTLGVFGAALSAKSETSPGLSAWLDASPSSPSIAHAATGNTRSTRLGARIRRREMLRLLVSNAGWFIGAPWLCREPSQGAVQRPKLRNDEG